VEPVETPLAVAPEAVSTPQPAPRAQPEPRPAAAKPEPHPEPAVAAAPAPRPAATEVDGLRGRWAEVIDKAPPAIKPLLRECRPVAINGARVTLAFPEERGFMREKATTRAAAIEALLGTMLGGSWAIECIASNVELEPLTVAQAVAADPADADGAALLEGVLRITGGELVDVPDVR